MSSFHLAFVLVALPAMTLGKAIAVPQHHVRDQLGPVATTLVPVLVSTHSSIPTTTTTTTTATDVLLTTTITNPIRTSMTAALTYNSVVGSILADLPPSGWTYECAQAVLYDYANATDVTQIGLVDQFGTETRKSLDGDTWGISYAQCRQSCGEIGINFDFAFFSNSMTSYLLPWLALCAQLPFEADDGLGNALSFVLIVGSPALAAYSLLITIFSRRAIQGKIKACKNRDVDKTHSRLEGIGHLVQQGQQAPLRISTDNDSAQESLQQVLVDERYDKWWKIVEAAIKGTQRRTTASLVAQLFVALLSYLFTVIASLAVNLGDHDTLLEISNGGLWLWLLAIVPGWVLVGVQNGSGTIERAFETAELATSATEIEAQRLPGNLGTRNFLVERESEDEYNILGHHEGPMFNFARFIESNRLVERILDIWQKAQPTSTHDTAAHKNDSPAAHDPDLPQILTPQGDNENAASHTTHSQRTCAQDLGPETYLLQDVVAADTASGMSQVTTVEAAAAAKQHHQQQQERQEDLLLLLPSTPTALPFQDSHSEWWLWRRMIAAGIGGLILHWGTTGSSFVIAYETYTIGLGCRSFSYLIYGGLGIIVFLLLAPVEVILVYADALATEQQRRQRRQQQPPSPHPRQRNKHNNSLVKSLRNTALVMQYLGCFLAVLNTLVLIGVSFLEPVGAFNDCFCQATALALGENGWVVLFKTANQLSPFEVTSTIAGFMLGFVAWVGVLAFAWLALYNKMA